MSQIAENLDKLRQLRKELIQALNNDRQNDVTHIRSVMAEIKGQQEKLVFKKEPTPGGAPFPTEKPPELQPEVDTPVSVDTSPHGSTHP